jgi:hypothetical protein
MLAGRMLAHHVFATSLKQSQTKVRQFSRIVNALPRSTRWPPLAGWSAVPAITCKTHLAHYRGQHSQSQSALPNPEGTGATDSVLWNPKPLSSDTNANSEKHPQPGGKNLFRDEEYIRRTNKVPADSEYPDLVESIAAAPKSVIYNTPRRSFNANSEFVDSGHPTVFRCNAYVGVDGGEQILGIGDGLNKVSLSLRISSCSPFRSM